MAPVPRFLSYRTKHIRTSDDGERNTASSKDIQLKREAQVVVVVVGFDEPDGTVSHELDVIDVSDESDVDGVSGESDVDDVSGEQVVVEAVVGILIDLVRECIQVGVVVVGLYVEFGSTPTTVAEVEVVVAPAPARCEFDDE
jgi:hypothetical protein